MSGIHITPRMPMVNPVHANIDLELRPAGSRPRVLVTGSRTWEDRTLIVSVLFLAWLSLGQTTDTVLVHGGARGADMMADAIWRPLGLPIEVHYADWKQYGKRAGFVRNKEMVAAGAHVCLAFIRDESKGATMCAQMAYDAGIPVRKFRA